MHPILFSVGSVTVYSFGLFLALAILFGSLSFVVLARYSRLNLPGFFDNVLFIIFLGVIGARLAYVISYPQFFKFPQGSWTDVFAIWQGGLVYYGAIIGGLAAVWLILRREKQYILKWLNIIIFGLLIGVVLGQVGCQFGGCAIGAESSSKIAIDGRLPMPTFEAVWALILFVAGLIIYIKRVDWRKDGRLFYTLSLLYLVGRVLCDWWREPLVVWWGLSAAIIADLTLMMITILMLLISVKLKYRDRETASTQNA